MTNDDLTKESEGTKRWRDWCRSHSLQVRCVEYEVPKGILPSNLKGILTDVKVGGPKRAPDDKIYLANKELRGKVARGNCILELQEVENGKVVKTDYIFLVFALRKFSGGMGDEDDSTYAQSQWEPYFIKPLSEASTVISTDKANGEAAHISSRKIFGETYFCIGSKNVHMLVRNKDDISKYSEGRFEFAQKVAHTFFSTILENTEIPEDKRKEFVLYLENNKYTMVAEMIQPEYQHVENLSYLKHPEFRFICFTTPDLENDFSDTTSYCPIPIDEAIEKAKDFGISTIGHEVFSSDGNMLQLVDGLMEKIRKDTGYEGKVLYFVDADNNTIGLIKKKTAWYIILRALREKVAAFGKSEKSSSIHEKCKKVEKRIQQIQRWLGFSSTYAEQWIDICTAFVKWLPHSQVMNSNTDVRSQFPVIFDEFLSNNENEKFNNAYKNLQGAF